MRELSVFVDESGNAKHDSEYYLLTLVFHDQSVALSPAIRGYESTLIDRGLSNVPFHIGPLLRGNDSYAPLTRDIRARLLACFSTFANKCPFRYLTLSYQKALFADDQALFSRMKRDLVNCLFDRLELLQSYDVIKIYYDNGQSDVTRTLHSAFEYALGKQAVLYKECDPSSYRLQQVADYACGIELAALKFAAKRQGPTERLFYGTWREFNKNYLKKLRRHLL